MASCPHYWKGLKFREAVPYPYGLCGCGADGRSGGQLREWRGSSLKDKHVPDQVLVKFAEGTDAAAVASALSKHGLAKKGEIYGSDTLIVEGKGKTVSAMIDALSKQPGVEFVEPDYIATADWVPNDPYWSQQWGPYQTYADLAWDVTKGSSSVMIAVVDTGVDLNHPDLASKVRTDIDWNYVNNTGTAQDDNGHGTHVAGTAAAITNNGVGIAGMCPNCRSCPSRCSTPPAAAATAPSPAAFATPLTRVRR